MNRTFGSEEEAPSGDIWLKSVEIEKTVDFFFTLHHLKECHQARVIGHATEWPAAGSFDVTIYRIGVNNSGRIVSNSKKKALLFVWGTNNPSSYGTVSIISIFRETWSRRPVEVSFGGCSPVCPHLTLDAEKLGCLLQLVG